MFVRRSCGVVRLFSPEGGNCLCVRVAVTASGGQPNRVPARSTGSVDRELRHVRNNAPIFFRFSHQLLCLHYLVLSLLPESLNKSISKMLSHHTPSGHPSATQLSRSTAVVVHGWRLSQASSPHSRPPCGNSVDLKVKTNALRGGGSSSRRFLSLLYIVNEDQDQEKALSN